MLRHSARYCGGKGLVRSPRIRRGQTLIYSIVSLTALIAITALAVDWGYVQCTKTELQRMADATAKGYLAYYVAYDKTTASSLGTNLYSSSWNPVDSGTGAAPTVAVTWGYWNTSTSAFVSGTSSTYPIAVRCVASKTAAASNALNLRWASFLGRGKQDITCTAIAVVTQSSQTISANVPATSNIWLASMPSGTTSTGGDNMTTATPYEASSIPVTPGTYMTFSYINGHASNGPSYTSVPPDGDNSWILSHDNGDENNISGLTAPINSLIGVFMNASNPTSTASPSPRDYSTAADRDQTSYDDIALKQTFFIGDGVTSTGTTQRFLVPAGATRLFLGTMDGFQWSNNAGNISCTVTAPAVISLYR